MSSNFCTKLTEERGRGSKFTGARELDLEFSTHPVCSGKSWETSEQDQTSISEPFDQQLGEKGLKVGSVWGWVERVEEAKVGSGGHRERRPMWTSSKWANFGTGVAPASPESPPGHPCPRGPACTTQQALALCLGYLRPSEHQPYHSLQLQVGESPGPHAKAQSPFLIKSDIWGETDHWCFLISAVYPLIRHCPSLGLT